MKLIYHNTQSNNFFKLENKKFIVTKSSKEMFTALSYSAINIKTLINKENLAEDVFTQHISNDVYNLLDLDKDKKYTIKYLKYKNRYSFFVLDKDTIVDISKYKYFTYEPLIYNSLFENNLLNKNKNICFLKIKQNDSFMVLYSNSEYVCSIKLDDFLKSNIFSNYNLNFLKEFLLRYEENTYQLVSNILKPLKILFEDKFEYIKNEFGIDIDKIFLDFDMLIDNRYIQIFKNNIDYKIENFNVNPLGSDSTSIILASMLVKTDNQKLNFISKYKVANNTNFLPKSVASVLLASAISLSYPIYMAQNIISTKIDTLNTDKLSKKIELDKQKLIASVYEYEKYKSQLKDKLSQMKDDKKEVLATLDDIKRKINYAKAQVLVNITNKLNISDVAIEKISIVESNGANILSISFLSPNEKEIKYIINELAYLDLNKKSIYKYNNYFKASIEAIV